MTLDEAIKYCGDTAMKNINEIASGKYKDDAKGEDEAIDNASKHFQLKKFLKDYKELLEQDPSSSENPNKGVM